MPVGALDGTFPWRIPAFPEYSALHGVKRGTCLNTAQ